MTRYEAIQVIADVLERAASTDAPRVVWPRDVAEQKFVFPRPRA